MVARAYTVAFEGVEARLVEVQCAVTPGMPAFAIVGLPDKAVSEARERVRAALTAMAIALPSKRITVNLSPADLPKEGSHFDLPIALALLAALEVIPQDAVAQTVALGELSLDGTLVPVVGALPAAMAAAEDDRTLLCPHACGAEAAWVGCANVIAPRSLADVVRHFTGQAVLQPAEPGEVLAQSRSRDLRDVKGQERAKRALEIAAAGRHHLMMVGIAGVGQVHAGRAPARHPAAADPGRGAGNLDDPFAVRAAWTKAASPARARFANRTTPPRWPPSSAAGAARNRAKSASPITACCSWTNSPNSPAPCWKPCASRSRPARSWWRAPMPMSATPAASCWSPPPTPANAAICADPARACARAPICGEDYLGRISGPLMDRFDLRVDVPPVAFTDLDLPATGDSSAESPPGSHTARDVQTARFAGQTRRGSMPMPKAQLLEEIATPDAEGRALLLTGRRTLRPVGARLSPGPAGRAHHRRSGGRRRCAQTPRGRGGQLSFGDDEKRSSAAPRSPARSSRQC